jgi:sugar (pentulose or hexulose) kinase
MTDRLLVGLDVGTSTCKAVAYTEDGVAVSQGTSITPWVTTATGAEMDPRALLDAAIEALARALAGAPDGPVAGVGVAGIGESGVLLDAAGDPIGPLIAWHDTRDDVELADLRGSIDAGEFARTTGLPLRHQWSLTKHRWLRTHHPDTAAAVRRLNVPEWIVRGLGGDEGCELSLASRTGWLRVHRRAWWDRALSWAGASATLMPPLVEAGTPLGRVRGAGPPRLAGAVLTVAGHDHQVAAIGAGALGPRDELDSCGTAEALVRSVAPGLQPDTVQSLVDAGVTVGWHALAGRWCLLGGTTGGLTLQRVLADLGRSAADVADLDRAVRDDTGGAAAVWRAALESVTEEVGVIHDAMSAVTGPHAAFVVTGGWSSSTALMAVKERRFGALRRPQVAEAGARGAALLAGLAAGTYAATGEFPVLP